MKLYLEQKKTVSELKKWGKIWKEMEQTWFQRKNNSNNLKKKGIIKNHLKNVSQYKN